MKKLIILVLCLSAGFGLKAQSFSPAKDSVFDEGPASTYKDLFNDIYTESTTEIKVSWKLKNFEAPTAWKLTICDNQSCIDSPKYEEEFKLAPFKSGDDTYFKVTMNPHNVKGQGIATVWVFDTDDETKGKEIKFVLNTWNSSVADEPSVDFNVYPNPARNTLNITFSKTPKNKVNVKVFNLLGQVQKNIEVNQLNTDVKIDISGLKNGNYLLQFVGEDGQLRTHRFTKRI